ncbi:unnamed protein product [Gadus morhua 'NCC']
METNQASLRDILAHSPFNTEEELLTELRAIESTSGTKIIIWNLRRTSEEITELDFNTENDIRIICDDLDTSDPESNSSLSAYCSILYLEPSMLIHIQGQRVEKHRIHESLHYIDRSHSYKPNIVEKKIPIIFGDNKSKQHYGLMMYYNNRLIKAYHRVGCQLKAKNRRGVGIIGVIECNHLTPTHNKQDFEDNITYRNTIKSVASKLRDYSGKRRNNPGDNVPIQETDDEMTDEDDESEESSGEGPSGTKRPKRNCDEGESESDRVLRSSGPARERELLEKIEKLNTKVEQLEEECKQKTTQVTELTEWKKKMQSHCNQ